MFFCHLGEIIYERQYNDRLKYTVTETSKIVENLNPNTEYRVVGMSLGSSQHCK